MRHTRRTATSSRFSRGAGLSPHHDPDTLSRAMITRFSRTKPTRAPETVKQKIKKKNQK
jgi:hypothetical protein